MPATSPEDDKPHAMRGVLFCMKHERYMIPGPVVKHPDNVVYIRGPVSLIKIHL